MEPKQLEKALEKIPYSISVVTVGSDGNERGLTVSWLTQVSFDPPMLLVAIDKDNSIVDFLQDNPRFVVNLLGSCQQREAVHFARPNAEKDDKIEPFPTRSNKKNIPILTDSLAYFDCQLKDRFEAGDHLLLIGEVKEANILNDFLPMTSAQGLRYSYLDS